MIYFYNFYFVLQNNKDYFIQFININFLLFKAGINFDKIFYPTATIFLINFYECFYFYSIIFILFYFFILIWYNYSNRALSKEIPTISIQYSHTKSCYTNAIFHYYYYCDLLAYAVYCWSLHEWVVVGHDC